MGFRHSQSGKDQRLGEGIGLERATGKLISSREGAIDLDIRHRVCRLMLAVKEINYESGARIKTVD
jgi:hypothetical protein